MTKVGFIGLTWTDSKGRKQSTKFNWNKDAKRLIGAAAAVALQRAGMEVRRNTQRGMVGGSTRTGRTPRSKPVLWNVGERDGFVMAAIVRQVPRPDKVSSWAPKAFLRNDIQSDYDTRSKSVVVGPSKAPWLNVLHERGGAISLHFMPIRPYPIGGQIGPDLKLPKKWERTIVRKDSQGRYRRQRGAYVGYMVNRGMSGTINLGTRQVRGRHYMENGLQASMHKIPKQFHDTISRRFVGG